MKKIIFLLLLLIVIPIYAKENRLYLIEDQNTIKYESGLYDEKIFLKHTDMVPGSKYTDELIIENGTDKPYKLYLKANKENQSEDAERLLRNINMKISLDGRIIYDGKANGQGNINLADSIYLGEFVSNKSVKMVVNTDLSVEYENPRNDDYSHIEWTFYAQVDEEPPQEIVPITGSNRSNILIIGFIVLLVISVALFAMYKKNKKAI